MTVPWGDYPDGTFDDDLSGLNGLNEASWRAGLNSQVVSPFDGLRTGIVSRFFGGNADAVIDLQDGQNEYNDRLDLLEGVRGYCSTVQGQTWFLGAGTTLKKLPMETQVGPNVGAVPNNGGIRAEEKGLWRFDALATFDPPNRRNSTPDPSWYSIAATLAIVVMSGSTVYSEKIMQQTLHGPIPDSATDPGNPHGLFLSHTVVIPTDGTHTAYTYVSQEGGLNSAIAPKYRIRGGTRTSGLWATKLDFRTDNNIVAPTVPDGGDL